MYGVIATYFEKQNYECNDANQIFTFRRNAYTLSGGRAELWSFVLLMLMV